MCVSCYFFSRLIADISHSSRDLIFALPIRAKNATPKLPPDSGSPWPPEFVHEGEFFSERLRCMVCFQRENGYSLIQWKPREMSGNLVSGMRCSFTSTGLPSLVPVSTS